jgi:hypothetical protein
VKDARADEVVTLASGPRADAVRRVLDARFPPLAEDEEVVAAVLADAEQLGS